MSKKKTDALDNLASLVSGGPAAFEDPPQLSDEDLERHVRGIIDYASAALGEADIFEVQDLIEAAAEEMRFQVRMLVEEGDEDV